MSHSINASHPVSSRWICFPLGFLLVFLSFGASAWAAGSVRYSYEKVEVGSDVQWVLVPRADLELSGNDVSLASKAFESLKKAKRSTYGSATVSISGRSLASAKASVKIDPKFANYKLIVMAETVYTLTELGINSVSFPGHSSRALKREDIPFSSYTLTVPLWRVLPNLSSDHVRVLLPDGSIRSSREVVRDWGSKSPEIIAQLYSYLEAPDAYTVTTVAKKLPELRVEYVPQVTALVSDSRANVRQIALDILADQRDTAEVASAVTSQLKKEKSAAVAAKQAEFLIQAKSKDISIEGHLHFLGVEDEKRVLEAAKALSDYKDPKARAALSKLLEDKREAVAQAGIDGLKKLNASSEQQAALKNSKVPEKIRLDIAADLTESKKKDDTVVGHSYIAENAGEVEAVRGVRALGRIKDDAARSTLEGYLTHDKRYLRFSAARELESQKSVESLPAFAAAVKDGKNPEHMEDTGYRILASQAQSVVLEQANSRDPVVKRMAYRALGESASSGGGGRIFDMLEKGLADRDARIRGASARAIGAFANDRAANALKKVVKDSNADVRADAAVAMGRFENATLIEELTAYLEDSAPQVKAAAMSSLAKRKEAASWDTIETLAGSSEPQVKGAAMKALAALVSREDRQGVRKVLSLLSGGVADSSMQVQIDALEALGTFEEGNAVTAITVQLDAEEDDVRMAAIRALGNTGHRSAVSLVAGVLSDPDPRIRRVAIEASGNLGSQARSALESHVPKEEDPELAELARNTLKSM